MEKYQEESKYIGCLLGGAIGDSIGGVVEFMQVERIRKIFGRHGIQTFAPSYGVKGGGAITDDTQMTLFTAEGLLLARQRKLSPANSVWRSYRDWYTTQVDRYSKKTARSPLMHNKFLWSQRAPGSTCMMELGRGRPGTPLSGSSSKGCGGVMRVAPAGMMYATERAYQVGCETAALTHGHVDGWAPAGAMAVIIREILDGWTIEQAVERTLDFVPRYSNTFALLCKAIQLADWAPVSSRTVAELGQGWTGDEALAIGVYCALATHDFQRGVLLSANHSGDSDSTASITGQILGAEGGFDVIPKQWRDNVEGSAVISDYAIALYERYAK